MLEGGELGISTYIRWQAAHCAYCAEVQISSLQRKSVVGIKADLIGNRVQLPPIPSELNRMLPCHVTNRVGDINLAVALVCGSRRDIKILHSARKSRDQNRFTGRSKA